MKIVIIIAFLFVLPMAGQRNKATLYFKDGSKKTGLAKITKNKEIKFRTKKGAKKEFYNYDDIDYVEIKVKNWDIPVTTTYNYKKTDLHNYSLLKEIIKGKLSLYQKTKTVSGGIMTGSNGSMTMTSTSYNSYYVWQKGDEIAVHLGDRGTLFTKNFKKAASKYFKDCPELVKKIKNKEFKKKDLEKVVKYYNENCG